MSDDPRSAEPGEVIDDETNPQLVGEARRINGSPLLWGREIGRVDRHLEASSLANGDRSGYGGALGGEVAPIWNGDQRDHLDHRFRRVGPIVTNEANNLDPGSVPGFR